MFHGFELAPGLKSCKASFSKKNYERILASKGGRKGCKRTGRFVAETQGQIARAVSRGGAFQTFGAPHGKSLLGIGGTVSEISPGTNRSMAASAMCRICLGIEMWRRRRFTRTSCSVRVWACGVRWTGEWSAKISTQYFRENFSGAEAMQHHRLVPRGLAADQFHFAA